MNTFKIKNRIYNIYKYGNMDFEFFFVGREEEKFWELQKKYERVESIPNHVLLKGVFFKYGTRDTAGNYVNRHIVANLVRK